MRIILFQRVHGTHNQGTVKKLDILFFKQVICIFFYFYE